MFEGAAWPTVAIIILNWNNARDTLACLGAVAALDYPAALTVVVDNGSADDSVARISNAHPSVKIIELSVNAGYTGGNNAGIRWALEQGAKYVWLLNDDVIVAPDSLSHLVQVAEGQPDLGFAGPMVRIREEPHHILSAGGVLGSGTGHKQRGLGEVDHGQYDAVTEVDSVSGCALFVNCRVIEEIGLLDEGYFAYHEEIDWCYRARQAGYEVLFVPQAKVWHPDTRTRDATSARVTYYMSRNRLLFSRKHRVGSWILIRTIIQYIIWILNWSINPKWRNAREKRNALLFALWDFLRCDFGKSRYV